ncbi:MAG: hypothetical protein AMJ42_00275 [Deltaproteobacteria bacterium DG_8]|nr:MAG: hypothetical protein AMJ42_00275 [Deltaproteobacteria bacterium DG_8]
MKIALISPYAEISSIGVRTISAYLKSNGISTRLVFLPLQKSFYSREDFSFYSDSAINDLADLVINDDLIGISLMSNFYDTVKDLTIKLKRKLPDKPIIWGGIHPTVIPEKCIEVADYLCIGEGELPCLDLCRHLAEGKSAENIPGIWSKAEGRIFRNNPLRVITDLNQIPPPDYDLEENYILLSKKTLTPLTSRNMHKFLGVTYWTMYTRGCPFSCTYCCNDALRKIHRDFTKLRAKSPEYIVQEIIAIKNKFPFIKYVNFQDDTLFALSEEDIKEFCEYYKKFVGLPFLVPGAQPSVFTEKKFDYLVDSGMLRTRVGIQCGSQRVLDEIYKRKQDNETVVQISHILQKYPKKLTMPNYDIIVDNPWETQKDRLQTIDLLSKLAPPFSLNIFSLMFFPGTSLYSKAIQENIINENTKVTHYLNYKPTYLNLIIALFGIFKVPEWLLKILLSKRLVNTKRNFVALHHILYNLILYRRGICSIVTRDFSMFPPSLQFLFCKFLPPRILDKEKIISELPHGRAERH